MIKNIKIKQYRKLKQELSIELSKLLGMKNNESYIEYEKLIKKYGKGEN